MTGKTLEDPNVLPNTIVHKNHKFMWKLNTEEDKIEMDADNKPIGTYQFLDERFSKSHFPPKYRF